MRMQISHVQFACSLHLFWRVMFRLLSGKKKSACQCRRCRFNPWVRKIPWSRQWQPTLVFLPGESPWTEEPGRLQSMMSQKVRQDWEHAHVHTHTHTHTHWLEVYNLIVSPTKWTPLVNDTQIKNQNVTSTQKPSYLPAPSLLRQTTSNSLH